MVDESQLRETKRTINWWVVLPNCHQKTSFLEILKLALDIARVFFDQLRQAADMGVELRILSIDHNDFAPHP